MMLEGHVKILWKVACRNPDHERLREFYFKQAIRHGEVSASAKSKKAARKTALSQEISDLRADIDSTECNITDLTNHLDEMRAKLAKCEKEFDDQFKE
jgi:cell division protein FtsB